MSTRENRSGKQTKEWILNTAATLFNTYGTAAISTNRIAKEMGISPGNLYYHYKNKEDIIRAIMKDKITGLTQDWDTETDSPLEKFLKAIQSVLFAWQDHIFFKKELVTLLHNDPELKRMYHQNRREFSEKSERLLQQLQAAGLFRASEEPDLSETLVTISFMLIEYWPNFLEINDEALTHDNLLKGVELILRVWRPYFTEKGWDELTRLRAGS